MSTPPQQQPQHVISRPSVASLLLIQRVNQQELGSATGFVVSKDGPSYLITNWHVAAGRRPDTGQLLAAQGVAPDELVVLHNVAGQLGNWEGKPEPLYDNAGEPLWLEHPVHGRQVDVVALPLTQLDAVELYTYDPWTSGPAIAFGPSGSLTIVGFPFGLTGGGAFGLWVQGTVASEPTLDFNDVPSFLIDSRTRPGQSGSPVIAYRSGGAVAMEDGSTAVFGGAPIERFVGVYSGRINAQSDLGIVWKADVVREIVDRGQRGRLP